MITEKDIRMILTDLLVGRALLDRGIAVKDYLMSVEKLTNKYAKTILDKMDWEVVASGKCQCHYASESWLHIENSKGDLIDAISEFEKYDGKNIEIAVRVIK